MTDTICAVSTPPGMGAVALVRVSGPCAFRIAVRLFRPGFEMESLRPRYVQLACVYDGGELLDQVMLTKFVAPHSYTGEDCLEIACHGSLYIQKRLLELLIDFGCRMAGAGEFTRRAFMNGKLDLPQAEAVADLIDSQTEVSHRSAAGRLKGGFSGRMSAMRAEFVRIASLLELELDFGEEDVEFAGRAELDSRLKGLQSELRRLIEAFKSGNVLKSGIPVAIAGRPNAGKSTLLNALLRHDRAIVSRIPGTTRDTVEDTFTIRGVLFRFIDTAGIRPPEDELEDIGIRRAFKAICSAAVLLYVFDIASTSPEEAVDEMEELKARSDNKDMEVILIANKIDRLESIPPHFARWHDKGILFVSAKRGVNIGGVEDRLSEYAAAHRLNDLSLLTNERHYGLLKSILAAVGRIRKGLDDGVAADLVAVDVRAALYDLGCLTGAVCTDEILDQIFSRFCIGK